MSFRTGLTFDDVALVPQFNNVPSRTEPDVSSWLTKNRTTGLPLVPANMDTVIGPELARVIVANKGIPIFHRFAPLEVQLEWVKEFGKNMFISTGIGKPEATFRLLEEGAGGVCIDVAHGHSKMMFEVIENIKNHFPDVEVIAGNICTPMAYQDLVNAGADGVKVGIGPGCFAAGTRILMANASYKNIEDVKSGDRVITGEGIPATVKRAFKTGYKKVSRLRLNIHHKDILVTPDHNFLVGDLSSTSQTTIAACGFTKLLAKQSKAVPKKSKIKWRPIDSLDKGCLLTPKIIQWEIPKYFEIALMKRSGGNWRTEPKFSIDSTLTPTYEVGYIFGSFLGDGNVHQHVNRGSHSASVHWSFGPNEEAIANKLSECIKTVFGLCPVIKKPENKNSILVSLYYKPLADFLASFGKRSNKMLPTELFVDNKEYLSGLWEGLLDSDGCVSNGRVSFINTSENLIELFNICTLILKGHFPNSSRRIPSIGRLKNCNLLNCSPSYSSRLLIRPERRVTNQHQIAKVLEYEDTNLFLDVYDLEIADSDHSFIAGNVIVHNSACTTRVVTGFGVPQFTAVYECAQVAQKLRVPIIADGGIRNSRDVVLALAAGASTVMIGKLFALTRESAAEKKRSTAEGMLYGEGIGPLLAKYRGQASEDFQNEYYGGLKEKTVAEGTDFWAPVSGKAQDLIDEILGGLRSGLTYGGARSIKELQRKAEFLQVTPAYGAESNPRRK